MLKNLIYMRVYNKIYVYMGVQLKKRVDMSCWRHYQENLMLFFVLRT